ncbi:HAMP domain-containing protein [candidate division KSB1 bacterium]|nr:HAMP domain-containing protein [candidate division KSB1 bacterium]
MKSLLMSGGVILGTLVISGLLWMLFKRKITIKVLALFLPIIVISGLIGFSVSAGIEVVFQGVLVGLGVVFLFVALMMVAKKIGAPLVELKRAGERVASGDMGAELGVVSGDEIGDLEATFNQMVVSIRREMDEIKDQQKSAKDALTEAVKTRDEALTEKETLQKEMEEKGRISEELRGTVEELETKLKEYEASEKDVQELKGVLEEELPGILERLNALKGGDLTVEFPPGQGEALAPLVQALSDVSVNLKNVISQMGGSSEMVIQTADNLAVESSRLVSGYEEQNTQARQVADQVENLSETINQTQQRAASASVTARRAGEIGERGDLLAAQLSRGIDHLVHLFGVFSQMSENFNRNAEKIHAAIDSINDIIIQANQLALTAAVEAARIGERGGGFVVVTDEIKKMTERVGNVSKDLVVVLNEIDEEIKGTQGSVAEGNEEVNNETDLAKKMGGAIQELRTEVDKLTETIRAIEQDNQLPEDIQETVNKGLEGISLAVNQTSQGAQSITRAAEDLKRLTGNLKNLLDRFQTGRPERPVSEGETIAEEGVEQGEAVEKETPEKTEVVP